MSTEFLEYWVGEQFVVAFANDDRSGITDAEESLFSRFLCDISSELGTWYEEITDESDEFGYCEVTCLHGPVVKVRFYPVQTY